MKYLDSHLDVVQWASEEFAIPYKSPIDGRMHRYFPDFYMKLRESTGTVQKYLVEVKPLKQCHPPKKTGIFYGVEVELELIFSER